ncbi:Ig-like domain-containing protein [Bacteroidales bacterium OttesenSCG-928-M11]|nr:Ig-like domain-containing protein [Bacteroidales bacterium OttesenSCG-928-M11]
MRKKIIFLILASFYIFSNVAFGQMKTVQYWFNDDFSNKTTQTVSGSQQVQLKELNSSHLTAGIHKVHIRAKDNDLWSIVHSQVFYKPASIGSGNNTMTKYEYWIDNDFTNRISGKLSGGIASISDMDLSSISDGIHILHIRTKDARDTYSSVHSQVFYKNTAPFGTNNEIITYEYWINGDFSNRVSTTTSGKTFAITNGFDLNNLSEGIYIINFRAKDKQGNWSGVQSQTIYVNTFTPIGDNKIDAYSYWYDYKYDERITVNLPSPVSPYELKEKYILPINFTEGESHTFHIHFRDTQGKWSATATESFKIVPLFLESEFDALATFYNSTSGNNWTSTLASDSIWNLNSIATVNDWKGVKFGEGRVTGLVLPNNNLKDSIPADIIENLPNLTTLNLKGNSIKTLGASLPSSINLNVESQVFDEGTILVNPSASLILSLHNISRYNHSTGLFTTNNTFRLYINNVSKTTFSSSNGKVTIGTTYTKNIVEGDVIVLEQTNGTAKGTRYTYYVAGVPVTSIVMNKTKTNLDLGSEEQLTYTITPDNASNKNVIWSSNNPEVASVENGLVKGLAVGTATITATTLEGNKTATCIVTVNPVAVTNIAMNKTETALFLGSSEQLSYTITPSNATNQKVTWSSSKPAVATVENGLVTALTLGTTTITVTSEDGSKKATCLVTVNPIAATNISLNKTTSSLQLGSTEQLTFTITPTNTTNQNVSWSSSNTKVASVEKGLVTALSVGTSIITVTTEDGNKTASCTITVNPISVISIDLNKTTANLLIGNTEQLTYSINPTDATNQNVSWSSSNTNVASVQDGLITALTVGTTTVTVTTEDGNKTASCIVTVDPITVSTIVLNKTAINLSLNATEQLTYSITPSNATNQKVTWSSSNSNIVSVQDGLITALAIGTATITITTEDGNKTANCIVTVVPTAVVSIVLNKTESSLLIGEIEQLTYTITPEDASNKNVTWNSSNKEVASVEDGLVKALAAGTTTISITTEDGNKKASCVFTVNRGPAIHVIEYFYDTDPGFGLGNKAGISQSEEEIDGKIFQSLTFNAPIQNLSDGFHTLYVRAKNSFGWSVTQSRPFVKTSLPKEESNEIEYMEYFFDKDPGYKEAYALEIESHDTEYAYNIDLSSIDRGFHTLYVRALNKYGQWSQVMSRPLYIMVFPEDFSPEITYAEYYFDTDLGLGKGTEFSYNPYQATIDFTADLNHLNNGDHTIYLRGLDKKGQWTKFGEHTFTIMDGSAIDSPQSDISVFPNPVVNELFIKNYDLTIDLIRVFNENGQAVYMEKTPDQSVIQIAFSSYPKGTYIIRLSTTMGEKTFKVIKK